MTAKTKQLTSLSQNDFDWHLQENLQRKSFHRIETAFHFRDSATSKPLRPLLNCRSGGYSATSGKLFDTCCDSRIMHQPLSNSSNAAGRNRMAIDIVQIYIKWTQLDDSHYLISLCGEHSKVILMVHFFGIAIK